MDTTLTLSSVSPTVLLDVVALVQAAQFQLLRVWYEKDGSVPIIFRAEFDVGTDLAKLAALKDQLQASAEQLKVAVETSK